MRKGVNNCSTLQSLQYNRIILLLLEKSNRKLCL